MSQTQVELAARGLDVPAGAVWRWATRWSGEADESARRELADAAAAGDVPALSRSMPGPAVGQICTPDDRAGPRKGEHASGVHDMFLQRPVGHRDQDEPFTPPGRTAAGGPPR